MRYVKPKPTWSWHIDTTEVGKTLCGRRFDIASLDVREADQLPLNDKSCETCLRLQTAQ